MKCTLLSRTILEGIPSASGIEKVGDTIYIMGDDSPWLFWMNERYEITGKIPVADVSAAVKGKIPKPVKPDLEAMALFRNELLLFGSGSKSPQRDVLVRVNIISKKASTYSLVQFYDHLCTAAKITRDDLNIEAAVIFNTSLLLFNRGNNCIYETDIEALLAFSSGAENMPSVKIFRITLPMLQEIQAGFSGACLSTDSQQIIFTASVENTPNWVDDGEILGSFI